MIELKVNEYCHICRNFKAVSLSNVLHAGGYDRDILTDVVCEHHDFCSVIYDYLIAQLGWRPISEYKKGDHDWVLVKYFDGDYECIPAVAEMRPDGKWYDRNDLEIPFEVRYFFNMLQISTEGERND